MKALALISLAGCSIAAGPFSGTARRVSGGGYGTTTVGPASASGSGKHVGMFICANCGYGVGTMPGYGHFSVTRGTETAETTDVNLDVYLEWLFRFTPAVNIAINTTFQTDTVQDPPSAPGDMGEVSFTAIRPTINWNFLLGPNVRFWLGGGYSIGGVGGTSTNGAAAVAGAQAQIGSVGFAKVLLRAEGSIARGANDFEQEWVNGGLVFWFDPDWSP